MEGERLNAFQKVVAMRDKKEVHHIYVGIFQALHEDYSLLFDEFQAPPFEEHKRKVFYSTNFDLLTVERLKRHYERFNRTEPLKFEYVFHYNCQTETEEQRIEIAHRAFIEQINILYKDEHEIIRLLNGELKEGVHYKLTIKKTKNRK